VRRGTASGQYGLHNGGVQLMDGLTLRLDTVGDGPRVAVKDLIDIEGTVTTGGSAAKAAEPAAPADAELVRRLRRQGARIVGKAALDELGRNTTGINLWMGTPRNPLDPELVPGGSSSGSAVAVAVGAADIGLGTDTGGSIRIPAACCGLLGLKPTQDRLSGTGIFPFSASLETAGPLASDAAGLERAMRMLCPDWSPAPSGPERVGRIRLPEGGERVHPAFEKAVDRALAMVGWETIDVALDGWQEALEAALVIMRVEGWLAHRHLLERADLLGPRIALRIERGRSISEEDLARARIRQRAWQEKLRSLFEETAVLALPCLTRPAPRLADRPAGNPSIWLTGPANLAGVPALAFPLRGPGQLPGAALQLLGPVGADELLVAAAGDLEAELV
jgi:amidase